MDLSFFGFRSFYGLFCGLSGNDSFPGPSALGFRVQNFLYYIRDGFGRSGVAPKERSRSCSVKMFARSASRGINIRFLSKRTRRCNCRENLCWHINNVVSVFGNNRPARRCISHCAKTNRTNKRSESCTYQNSLLYSRSGKLAFTHFGSLTNA